MSGFFKRRKRKASVLEAERIDLDQELDCVLDGEIAALEAEVDDGFNTFAEEVAKSIAKENARNRRWKR